MRASRTPSQGFAEEGRLALPDALPETASIPADQPAHRPPDLPVAGWRSPRWPAPPALEFARRLHQAPAGSACPTRPGRRRARPLRHRQPDDPVTWPVRQGRPDRGRAGAGEGRHPAALQLRRLPRAQDREGFEKKYAAYDVKVRVSTFNDTDEALTKIRAGSSGYDIYFPSYDQIAKMVSGKLIRPLNQSYIPNIANVWPEFSNPWYDGEWHYTVPVQRLHDRHRLAGRPHHRRHRAGVEPLRRVLGPGRTPVSSRSSTTGTPRWRMVALRAGHHRHQLDEAEDLAIISDQMLRHAAADQPQGHHHDVQRPAGGPARPGADVVGRRRQRAVLPAQGRRPGGPCATGTRRTARGWSTTTSW